MAAGVRRGHWALRSWIGRATSAPQLRRRRIPGLPQDPGRQVGRCRLLPCLARAGPDGDSHDSRLHPFTDARPLAGGTGRLTLRPSMNSGGLGLTKVTPVLGRGRQSARQSRPLAAATSRRVWSRWSRAGFHLPVLSVHGSPAPDGPAGNHHTNPALDGSHKLPPRAEQQWSPSKAVRRASADLAALGHPWPDRTT